jgi:hypothetical protein
MSKGKASISRAGSYREIGEFWDEHDLTDFWDQTEPAEFEVDIQSERRYYALERDLSDEMIRIARKRGLAVETLINLWLKEKILEQTKGLVTGNESPS